MFKNPRGMEIASLEASIHYISVFAINVFYCIVVKSRSQRRPDQTFGIYCNEHTLCNDHTLLYILMNGSFIQIIPWYVIMIHVLYFNKS